jgi:peptidoglycan hydrolase-like protein with peptidoglycan-binding domain
MTRTVHVGRHRALVVTAITVFVLGIAVAASVALFGGGTPSNAAGFDNGSPISVQRVERQDLSSQTEVSATLGYADPATIVQPTGTASTVLDQAQQAATTAAGQLAAARTGLAADAAALAHAAALLTADRQKLSVDCAGDAAGQTPATGSSAAGAGGGGSGGASGACAADAQSISTDNQAVAQARSKLTTDRQAVAAASAGLAGAAAALDAARASAAFYGASSTYTQLPTVGEIVRRNHVLYEISGEPVVLLYGPVAPWRAFVPGMAPGRDVAELNRNLRALGFGGRLGGDAFTAATTAAVKRFQVAHGLPATGMLLLGSVVFTPGAVRVTGVTPTIGAAVQPGPVLTTTSTAREVKIALDAGQQSDVAVGDPVLITLPDQSTTLGRITYVGTVATTPSSSDQGGGGGGGGGGSSSPTIEVDVTPTHPAATGRLDQAPVTVSITTGRVHDALVVPVNALLALGSGGYAVEVVAADGAHHLVGVTTGLFDDANGLVQVTSSGLAAGQRVVVPGQ